MLGPLSPLRWEHLYQALLGLYQCLLKLAMLRATCLWIMMPVVPRQHLKFHQITTSLEPVGLFRVYWTLFSAGVSVWRDGLQVLAAVM